VYRHEFWTREQHAQLISVLSSLPCKVALSGYYSDLYAEQLKGWRSIQYASMTRGGAREEWLWMNYPEPLELADYRYLGENFRERERLSKMRRRWLARLASMNRLERLMLSQAIAEQKPT
jgi:hypothetical protein